MKKLILFLYFLFSINFVNANNLNLNECIVKDNNISDFFSCVKAFTSKEEDSFWKVSILFWVSDVSVSFVWGKIIYKNTTQWYLTKCDMSIWDKSEFIDDLENWSKWNFSSDDLSYSECEVIDENENDLNSDYLPDMQSLYLVDENSEYTIFSWNNKAYIYTSNVWIKVNGKVFGDSLCEISSSDLEWLRIVWEYIADNLNIYANNSYIDYESWKTICKVDKLSYNLDSKTFEHLWWNYYKDKNSVYFLSSYDSFYNIERSHLDSFIVNNNDLNKASDKNHFYDNWKIISDNKANKIDEDNRAKSQIDIFFNQFDKKLENKSSKIKFITYKKLYSQVIKIKKNYKKEDKKEIIDYLHKKVYDRYIFAFREYASKK